MSTQLPSPGEKHNAVQNMFDRIAPGYDRMNALMTLGTHKRWKKAAIDSLNIQAGNVVADLACGTGDLAQEAARRGADAVGLDFSREMLVEARQRNPGIAFVHADAEHLPFADGSVDAISCGFALRNFVSIEGALTECARVLKPGGRLALVEVDTPRALPLRLLHGFYFNKLVPFVGGLIADRNAYAYLPESVAYLPNEQELRTILARCGFTGVVKRSFMFGAAQLISARRAAALHCNITRIENAPDTIAIVQGNKSTDAFYWEHPASGRSIATVGCVREIRSTGPDRFSNARAMWSDVIGTVQFEGDTPPCPVPLLVGGFGFFDEDPPAPWQGFPSLRFVIPKTCWIRFDGSNYRVDVSDTTGENSVPATTAVEADTSDGHKSDEERLHWLARASAVLESIAAGTLKKLVLARTRTVSVSDGGAAYATAQRLRETRPTCATFMVRSNGRIFSGSSPEVLARVHERRFETAALAGSAPRFEKREKDEESSDQLLACPKNAHEHAIVVNEMRTKLAPLCIDVIAASRPELRTVPEAFHLSTPLSGHLDEDSSVLDVAGALHPTSAVCGMPSAPARERLCFEEPERGWYAGGVGWMDASGDGEITVALRSALFDGRRAVMWAGAGIVEGSVPESEFAETEAKLTALHGALEESALTDVAYTEANGSIPIDQQAEPTDDDDPPTRRAASA